MKSVSVLFASLAFAACAHQPPPPGGFAEVVVLGGQVVTVDPKFTVAEALAARGGLFVKIGSEAEIRPFVGPATRVIEAHGKTVLPGLIESHVHSISVARDELIEPFTPFSSIEEMQAWLRKKASRVPAGQWIQVPRTYPTRLRERRFPTRSELDAVAGDHPVVVDGAYAQVLNSLALQKAGITRDTASPPGREIAKDAAGEPTGLLRNMGGTLAKYLAHRTPSDAEVLDMIETVHRHYNAVGITSIIERGADPPDLKLFERLKAEGRLRVRTNMTFMLESDGTLEGAEKWIRALPFHFADGDDWLRVGPLKIVVDGGILIGTSYMRQPYGARAGKLYDRMAPDYRGTLSMTAERIENSLRAGNRLGWQMVSHVTGDGAVDLVLDAVAKVGAEQPMKRYVLVHGYFPNPEAIRRAAVLGVAVDTQPPWYFKDADAIATALDGDRVARFIGLHDWLAGGVVVAINTDHMLGLDANGAINPYNPFLTLYTAITRKTEGGQVIGPGQRVSRQDALRMMTVNAAYLSFDENRKGSIEAGKLADFVVVDGDFLGCPEDAIRDLRVLTTVVGGRTVYARPQ